MSMRERHNRKSGNRALREKLHEIIFEADTLPGKIFDIILLVTIVASVLTVILESIPRLHDAYLLTFHRLEWFFTIIFTLEYLLRLYCVYRPWHYARSFYGIIDLLAILPTYLNLIITGGQYFLIIRALRLMRIFRVLKLGHYIRESAHIAGAMRASVAKITVFMTFVLLMVTIIGSLMYLVEGGANEGFSNIPSGIYWAIVTLTTVGYGDITPVTNLGRILSAIVMILGYAVLAVPTGIVSAEFVSQRYSSNNTQACRYCGREGHADDAKYCKYCGEKLNPL